MALRLPLRNARLTARDKNRVPRKRDESKGTDRMCEAPTSKSVQHRILGRTQRTMAEVPHPMDMKVTK